MINQLQLSPVIDGQKRPLWSVLIPCFNCADFLRSALSGVLNQDQGPECMEIIVVDDCSTTDDPAEVVRDIGKGRVRILRQSSNVGKVRNYETGLLASCGHLVHQLHGDDMVQPGFYQAMAAAFDAYPEAGAFFCESDYIDETGAITDRTGQERPTTGILENWLLRIATTQRIQTPSMVVRRNVYEELGGFDRRLDCSEDWEMWIRIARHFPVGFCAEARAQYRTSPSNNSTRSILSGTRGRTQRLMFDLVDEYLPLELARKIREGRNVQQAYFFASSIPMAIERSGLSGWFQLCREIFRFSRRPQVIRRVASLTLRSCCRI